ncbi:hypothetical protein [Rothia nasimurium]|uniref:hypothetical protein n=1 Tax=Rothia nasimurium TaxID=85336 RepID=UPI001F27916B|nr:hypothetical protein [Rothia nasimurium]
MKKILVFSVGLNGYAFGFRKALESHQKYSERIGADYFVASKLKVNDPAIAAWMKVTLIDKALEAGYDYVAYIDADCEVQGDTPNFIDLFDGSTKSVLMAKGVSGRWNSGVIFVENTHESRMWTQALLKSITEPIAEEHRKNLRFENGNIIAVESKLNCVTEIDYRWNNSYQSKSDYIHHYTGKFKNDYRRNVIENLIFKFLKFISPRATAAPERRDEQFREDLLIATNKVWDEER